MFFRFIRRPLRLCFFGRRSSTKTGPSYADRLGIVVIASLTGMLAEMAYIVTSERLVMPCVVALDQISNRKVAVQKWLPSGDAAARSETVNCLHFPA
jgi:hypothetical protein